MALGDVLAKLRLVDTDSAGDALLRRVDTVLMLFDDQLYNLTNRNTAADASGAGVVIDNSSPESIARAANSLLGSNGAADDREANVLLLLPPAMFLATPVNLPGVAPDARRAALQLQAASLLPAYDEPLSLLLPNEQSTLALWLPEPLTDNLFSAFAEAGLFLTGIAPRPALVSADTGDERLLVDKDASGMAVVQVDPTGWQHVEQVALIDLEEPVFADQWRATLERLGSTHNVPVKPREFTSVTDYFNELTENESTAVSVSRIQNAAERYVIYPQAALAARYRLTKGKRRSVVATAVAATVILTVLPFLVQTLQARSLQSQLQQVRELAAPARADQSAVREFEDQWGVLTEFPRQDLATVLLTLQDVIAPSVLTSIEIEEGFITIEGDSPDPQNLLEQLEQNPLFTEVDFARATNNTRYYIDLRLTSVNFPAYQEWYFPEVN